MTASVAALCVSMTGRVGFAGEPAREFLNQLRAAGYYDMAISYLDRLDQYPGVDPDLKSAVPLEKAQALIDAGVASRNPAKRDEYFLKSEQQIAEFLKLSAHPRLSEARLQLGKLQMVRASQLLSGKPDDEKRKAARESYLAASKTFDAIVDSLRGRLKEMQGARVDDKDKKQLALRDQYRGEFLQAMGSAGESRRLAASTFKDPAKEGKELLTQSLAMFKDLSEKYDTYVQGAIAMLQRGQVQEQLGDLDQALDSYMRMLEKRDADPLRDAKFQATTSIIRLTMAKTPAKYQSAIDRGKGMIDGVRPNERNAKSVQDLRLALAKAYLEKSKDDKNLKPIDVKRALSSGRQLLVKASKIPGDQAEEANELLATMGIDLREVAELPTAEDPDSLEDALEKSRELLSVAEQQAQSLAVLGKQENPADDVKTQIAELEKQLRESQLVAAQILRRGLSMVTPDSDNTAANQARQYLAYLSYQAKRYRDAAVVGGFLAKNAPGSEEGLRGGLLALNALQLLLMEDPDNDSLIQHLQDLGSYLTDTWPDDPEAASAQGVMIKLALRSDRWDEARKQIAKMPEGPERGSFRRLMGQLLWNKSIQARQAENVVEADQYLADGATELAAGLESLSGKLVDPETMKASLVLAKIYLKQGEIAKAAAILDHETYGPIHLRKQHGSTDQTFTSDLYSTELQVVVQRMTSENGDTKALLERATGVMEKLRASVAGPDAQKRLTAIYIRMARDIRQQLETAAPAQRIKLIGAFRVFLDRISKTTKDVATLQWVGKTLMDLAEASMPPGKTKATGQAADLLTTAVATFERLKKLARDAPLTIDFQMGKADRLLGNYQKSIDTFEKLLKQKPMMLDAQMQAALAYEQWAAVVPPKFAGKAYRSALMGGRPDAQKKNIIWGWGRISLLTSRDPKYQTIFFESRYHVALCRFLWGKAAKKKTLIEKSVTDITQVAALYPNMGGPERRTKFDQLLKLIQKELGQKQTGLAAPQAKG